MAVIKHGGDVFGIAAARGWDWRDLVDFSASINPLGPAPGVRSAICRSLDRISHYPEREPARLRRALAELWQVSEEQILLGNGATELIFFVARMLPAVPATLALPVFSEFQRAFPDAAGAALRTAGSWPTQGILVLTRPANPTGYTVAMDVLHRHKNQPVLVDESFLEFTALSSAASLIEQLPHLMILRSLTKFYALPGLRIGALIMNAKTARDWREQREPWQVNVLAEEAALAAISDKDHAARSVAFVRSERQWLQGQIGHLPHTDIQPSDANFLYVGLGYPAEQLCRHLLDQKILVRNCADWPGLNREAVRIAVRTRPENGRLLRAWREFQ